MTAPSNPPEKDKRSTFGELSKEAAKHVADEKQKAEANERIDAMTGSERAEASFGDDWGSWGDDAPDEAKENPVIDLDVDFDAYAKILRGATNEQRVATPMESSHVPAERTLSPVAADLDRTPAPAAGTLTGPNAQVASALHELGGTWVSADAARQQQALVISVDRAQERIILTWRAPGDRFGRDAAHRVADRGTALRWLAATSASAVRPHQRLYLAVSEAAGLSPDERSELAREANAVVALLVEGDGEPTWECRRFAGAPAAVAPAAPIVAEPAPKAAAPVSTDQGEWLEAVSERLAADPAAEKLEAWNGVELAIHRNQREPFTGRVFTSLTGTVEDEVGRVLPVQIELVPGRVIVDLKELRIWA